MTAVKGARQSTTRSVRRLGRLARADVTRQFRRFVLVGVSNTIISFLAYTVVVSAGMVYWAAGAVAFMLGAVNGYLLNRGWTFACPDSAAARLKYLVVQLFGLGATTALLLLLVSAAAVGRIPAYAMTLPIVIVTTFLANRHWTFGAAGF